MQDPRTLGLLLSIAGHDPGGGAGLGADLALWQAMGWRGASACTALTVQGAAGVERVEPSAPDLLRAVLRAVCAQTRPLAVKIGMLGSADVAAEVAAFCAGYAGLVVWDPVLGAGSGGQPLLRLDGSAAVLKALAAQCSVITPNRDEAAALLGVEPWSGGGSPPVQWLDAVRGQWLQGGRTQAVVLKGGHGEGSHSTDWLVTRDALQGWAVPRVALPGGARVHGTGCLHSACLAAMLAEGWSLADAVVEAQWRTHAAIAHAWRAGSMLPLARPGAPLDSGGFPELVLPGGGVADERQGFRPLHSAPGFYPVVPDADWALRLLDWGVGTLQLRIKDLAGEALQEAIGRVSRAAHAVGAQLFVNDHWREAIAAQAFGVHLGQDDLGGADLRALRAAGLRLGISTHTPAEMARAHALRPSYLAFGPVFPTTLKAMPYRPLGLERLRDWAGRCKPRYAGVAIGGIGLDRIADAFGCGADGVAVVSAVTQAADPHAAVQLGLQLAQRCGASPQWR